MSGKEGNVSEHGRHDRLLKEHIHDPYMTRSKPKEPTVCPDCGVAFSGGRWDWLPIVPEGAHQEQCPACQRMRDKIAAGFLTLSGEFFTQHREEIMHLVNHIVEAQRAQHPMKRLMDIENQEDGGALLTFTEAHLPTAVGEAVEHAYKGDLDIQYAEEAGIVRVYWQR